MTASGYVPPIVRDALLKNTEITTFEYAALIGTRARQIENGDAPRVTVPPDVHDPLVIAAEEFRARVIPARVRRFYSLAGKRLQCTFGVHALDEPLRSVGRLRVLRGASRALDPDGQPAVYDYLTPRDITYVLDHTFNADPPPGHTQHFIRPVAAPTAELMERATRRVRAQLTEDLRRRPFVNTQYLLQQLAAMLAIAYNASLVQTLQLMGYLLAEAVIETQGVISAFHSAGKKVSALKALEATASLVKGKWLVHHDCLVFAVGAMDPFRALTCSQTYSDVRLGDLLLTEPFPARTDTLAGSPTHVARLRADGHGGSFARIGDRFLRIAFDTTKMLWHNIQLQGVVRRLRRILPANEFVVVPSPAARGLVDILFVTEPDQDVALQIKTLETYVIDRVVKKWSVSDGGVRGVSDYEADVRRVTSFVVHEIHRGDVAGGGAEYLWQIHRQELDVLLPEEPFSALLRYVDPQATFAWIPTDVAGEEYSRQARVVIHPAGVRRCVDEIEALREVNRRRYVTVAEREHPEMSKEAQARVSARQLEYTHTPTALINALADELIMVQDVAAQTLMVDLLSNRTNDFAHNLELLRSLRQQGSQVAAALTPAQTDFLARFRITCLLSQGSNFLENIRCVPGVDPYRSYPVNPRDAFSVLGTEAARAQQIRVFLAAFAQGGKKADPRHLELITDVMFRSGVLTNLEDLDSAEVNGSVMRNAMRGRATAVFRNASMRDSSDSVPGVLFSNMTGTRVVGGTGGVLIVPDAPPE